jgi:hypothetical protein
MKAEDFRTIFEISAGEIWETPSLNLALTVKTIDKVESAVGYYEELIKNKSKEKILDELTQILYNYYEFAIITHAIFKDAIPKGFQKKMNDLINEINGDADRFAELNRITNYKFKE